MGELFKRPIAARPLGFTGERLTTEVSGQIMSEHYHRYFLAREFCRGKRVLDIASGEGYGSAMLAQCARSVTGVDISPDAVEHARNTYDGPNYLVGSTDAIPADDASFDVVVSFETIEHVADHQLFLSEIRRVLRSDGVLIISTPDRDLYTPPNAPSNIYHVHELTKTEFTELLHRHFEGVHMYYQRAILGSSLLLDGGGAPDAGPVVFEKRGEMFEKSIGMPRAPYMVAVASNSPVELPACTLYFETGEPYGQMLAMEHAYRAEERKFREAEAAFRTEEARLCAELARCAADMDRAAHQLQEAHTLIADFRQRRSAIAGIHPHAPGGIVGALRRKLTRCEAD